ncbi:hypothetical protein MPSEU_000323700 [Mayamaea pseudoterrestris]|nr:hypothetical protein MPSEU_000323700 [Mayamaea pseudoterrestris]
MTDYHQTLSSRGGHYPTDREIADTLTDCRKNNWQSVFKRVMDNPRLATTKLPMENHIITTVIHQAITAKGDTVQRANLILHILNTSPNAAGIANGYASYPLHSIAQRNTKMDAKTKETLIFALLDAYPGALLKQNNQGQRTPLHVLFTDYISPQLTQAMIAKGPNACFIKDKKGFLPAHIACSRHCSPEKLHMLMEINPDALYAKTKDGDTLLSLATSTATKSHPNKTLIDALEILLGMKDGEKTPTRRLISLSPIEAPLMALTDSPMCPGIDRGSSYGLHKTVPSKRGRRFSFEEAFMETIPATISLDLTVDDVGIGGGNGGSSNKHCRNGLFKSDESEAHDDLFASPSMHRPTKKRKMSLHDNDEHDHDQHGHSGPNQTTMLHHHHHHHHATLADAADDSSDTANLLLHLAARVSPPCTSDKAAAHALTQFAQV